MLSLSKTKLSSRKLPSDFASKATKAHAQLVGEVVWGWNALHMSYALLFIALMEDYWKASTIWNAAVSDSVQRDMLYALAESGPQSRTVRSGARWALKQTGKFAKYRNDLVHGIMGFAITDKGVEVRMGYFGNPWARIERHHKDGLSLKPIMTALRGDLMQLADYVHRLTLCAYDEQLPSPRRPSLRIPRLEQGQRSQDRAQPPKPRRPPQRPPLKG